MNAIGNVQMKLDLRLGRFYMNKEDYLLVLVGEESAEVAQMASKCIRFGVDEIYPLLDKTNAERLVQEFNDLYGIMIMLRDAGVIEYVVDVDQIEAKKAKVEKYYAYSQELGRCE